MGDPSRRLLVPGPVGTTLSLRQELISCASKHIQGLRFWWVLTCWNLHCSQTPSVSIEEKAPPQALRLQCFGCPAAMLWIPCISSRLLWKQLLRLLPEVFFWRFLPKHMQLNRECSGFLYFFLLWCWPQTKPKPTTRDTTNRYTQHMLLLLDQTSLALPKWQLKLKLDSLLCNPLIEWMLKCKQKANFTLPATRLWNFAQWDCSLLAPGWTLRFAPDFCSVIRKISNKIPENSLTSVTKMTRPE